MKQRYAECNGEGSIYVQYGCGFSPGEGWLNFDSSPTLRIEAMPLFGKLLSARFSGNEKRFPPSVRYGNICRGLPIPEGVARGVYASHVLEHLSLSDFRVALVNTYTILRPSGIFRLVVPDLLARAQRYVSSAEKRCSNAAQEFLRASRLGKEQRPRSVTDYLRDLIGGSAHLWMWDEASISDELKRVGFVNIRICEMGDLHDKMFERVRGKRTICG